MGIEEMRELDMKKHYKAREEQAIKDQQDARDRRGHLEVFMGCGEYSDQLV